MEKQEHKKGSGFLFMRGSLEIALKNAFTGEVIEKREIRNIVVTAGRRWVLEKIQSESPPAEEIEFMAIGSITSDAPDTAETALASEQDRKAIGTMQTSNLTGPLPSWEAQTSWATNEGNTTIGEVGLFNSSAGGTMLARATFATLDKTTSNTLTISYTISN